MKWMDLKIYLELSNTFIEPVNKKSQVVAAFD